jgi:glutamate/tyrosine decarboxylase-like PLP-dependent enzyme
MKSQSEAVSKKATFFKSNPLHFDIFTGNVQQEAEVIQMTINLFKGSKEVCGLLDSSEADCIRNVIRVYKSWGNDVKNITKPNVVAIDTFHPSLGRSCELFDVELRRVPVGNNIQLGKNDFNLNFVKNCLRYCSKTNCFYRHYDAWKIHR